MKLILALIALTTTPAFATPHTISGPVRAYKGPEGEQITMIPLDQNTKMLVLAHNTFGIYADQPLIYDFKFDNMMPAVGFANFPEKENALAYSMKVVLSKDQGTWTYADFLDPAGAKMMRIKLEYSEELSAKVKAGGLVKRGKEFQIGKNSP